MGGSQVALVVLCVAVVSALPQPEDKSAARWPGSPDWWPDNLPWPVRPDQFPDAPVWWPDVLPWPPGRPDLQWPDQPSWWPGSLPWPPARPDGWPDQPSWWPDSLPWPPARPEGWPDQPTWWPDSLPWPPALPELQWPDQPSWWPESLPWPPALPELQWPDQPSWWPEHLPWPPALPELQWPDQPSWWPDSLPWPPALPEIQWPPPGINIDRLPYVPSRDNQFHLFTRRNPYMSQPLVFNNYGVLFGSHYNPRHKTIVLIHDFRGSAASLFNSIMVPASLAAGDNNVILTDWSAGANSSPALSTFYSSLSANFVARFLNWVVEATNGDIEDFHLVGVGLGAWNAGVVGLRMNGRVGRVTALDPSRGLRLTGLLPSLTLGVARQTEVIHTTVSSTGFGPGLGHLDFYPNGGRNMPGCGDNSQCSRDRAVYYFAESLQTGGFSAIQCRRWRDALEGNCDGPGRAHMGGRYRQEARGIFYLRTNVLPPFSQG